MVRGTLGMGRIRKSGVGRNAGKGQVSRSSRSRKDLKREVVAREPRDRGVAAKERARVATAKETPGRPLAA